MTNSKAEGDDGLLARRPRIRCDGLKLAPKPAAGKRPAARKAAGIHAKNPRKRGFSTTWCPGEDSNLHGVAPASTCRQCVSQFRPPGGCRPSMYRGKAGLVRTLNTGPRGVAESTTHTYTEYQTTT